MSESDFEGTLVLEKLAAIDKLDDFYAAVDRDDFAAVTRLLRMARIDPATIETVLNQMTDG